jgi:hypothetical protein
MDDSITQVIHTVKKESLKSNSDFIPLVYKERVSLRESQYKKQLKEQEMKINEIISKCNQDQVDSLVNFIESKTMSNSCINSIRLINCGIVLGGFSGNDKNQFYSLLKQQINTKIIELENENSIKDIIKKLTNDSFDIEKVEEDICVIIKSFETFNHQLLTRFIAILQEQEFKTTLIFGLINMETLFNLKKETISKLNQKIFNLTKSKDILNEIVECMINSKGMKLGILPFKDLIEKYSDSDLSISSFVQGLKYSEMCFYYGNPLSIFMNENIKFNDLSESHFDMIRQLTSFVTFIENIKAKSNSDDIKLAISLLKDDYSLYNWTLSQIEQIENRNYCYSLGLKILLEMQQLYKSRELQWTISNLHYNGLQDSLDSHEHVQTLIYLLKKLEMPTLYNFIEKLIQKMDSENVEQDIHDFINECKQILDEYRQEITSSEQEESSASDEEQITTNALETIQKQFQQKRKSKVSSRTIARDLFEKSESDKLYIKVKKALTKLFK